MEGNAQGHSQTLQRVWTQAVPGACHLMVADGVAAVACNSGVLLLLDADSGALIRCTHAVGLMSVHEQACCHCLSAKQQAL